MMCKNINEAGMVFGFLNYGIVEFFDLICQRFILRWKLWGYKNQY